MRKILGPTRRKDRRLWRSLMSEAKTYFGSMPQQSSSSSTAIANAASLDKVYLPSIDPANVPSRTYLTPTQGAPPSRTYNTPTQNNVPTPSASSHQSQILKFENDMNENGYHYAYETSDGTKVEENGRVIPGVQPEEGSIQVEGSYSYVGVDGQTYSITYTADENGYHAAGDHLPTPPPIPEAILRSLELTAGSGGQYDKKKSSYDADAGY
ncbi:Cuticle protein 3 [Papilio xuthus]|uniref:Cuticle protein 3 n=1 Tax=Papilio xuthus TaxID=66420 RepID=A0A194QGP2_PAPXU|nr:Cuticle protein 3 [Papilio xuthus]